MRPSISLAVPCSSGRGRCFCGRDLRFLEVSYRAKGAHMKSHRNPALAFALIATSIAAATTLAFAPPADAQGGAPVTIKQVWDNIYFVDAGGGGNAGFIIGKDGVIVVDTTTNSGKQIVDGIAKLTPKPITTVILSHSDIDHVGGLKSFPQGLTII